MAVRQNANAADSFAEFIGLSAPEMPKYLVLNNFLINYFRASEEFDSVKTGSAEENERVFTQENDTAHLARLEASFRAYFNSYSGYEAYTQRQREGTKPWFYPVIPGMLKTTEQFSLRHLPYALQRAGKTKYPDMQERLYRYLYGNEQDIHNIFRFVCGPLTTLEQIRLASPPEREFGAQSCRKFFKELAKRFDETLNQILGDDYLLKADFFTRIEFLSSFLSLYVMEYILERTNDAPFPASKNVFLCKGSANPGLGSGPFHRACITNYSGIRARFPELLKVQFREIIEGIETESFVLRRPDASDDVRIAYGEQEQSIVDFLVSHRLSPLRSDKAKEKLTQNYGALLPPEREAVFSKEDFALQCFNIQKRTGGSTISKVSSILRAMGQEIHFVYPRSRAKQKYFAFSEELASFLVRLYLIRLGQPYAYYDDFVGWLSREYHMYVSLDYEGELKGYLGRINADIPMSDLNQNEQEFIRTLTNVNCLIKLSDSGYLVVLPDKKGGLTFL